MQGNEIRSSFGPLFTSIAHVHIYFYSAIIRNVYEPAHHQVGKKQNNDHRMRTPTNCQLTKGKVNREDTATEIAFPQQYTSSVRGQPTYLWAGIYSHAWLMSATPPGALRL